MDGLLGAISAKAVIGQLGISWIIILCLAVFWWVGSYIIARLGFSTWCLQVWAWLCILLTLLTFVNLVFGLIWYLVAA